MEGESLLFASFWTQVTPDAWVSSFGTLLGSLIGAFLGAMGALFAVKKQLKDDKENRNFEYVKEYFFISATSIGLLIHSLEEFYKDYYNYENNSKKIEGTIEQINQTFEQCKSIPREIIPKEKFDMHFEIYVILIELEATLKVYDKFFMENEEKVESRQILRVRIDEFKELDNKILKTDKTYLPDM